MEEGLTFTRETVKIEGDRNLYNYTFHAATPMERLASLIESGELAGVSELLDSYPDLDLAEALDLARRSGRSDVIEEIEARRA